MFIPWCHRKKIFPVLAKVVVSLFFTSMPIYADITLYPAKKVITMEPELTFSNAVAVENGRIFAVGKTEQLKRQLRSHKYNIDESFANKIIMPGFIDNHLHPSMAAVLMPMEFITPFDWTLPNRKVAGVTGKTAYLEKLTVVEANHGDKDKWLISWGYHHYFHGNISRRELDAISLDRPIIVWHRSFHEIFANTAALLAMGVKENDVEGNPHINYAQGHFFETGMPLAFLKLAPIILAPDWFSQGMELVRQSIHQGGITTIADMATGMFNLPMEWPVMKSILDAEETPFRTLLIPTAAAFGKTPGNDESIDAIEKLSEKNSEKLFFPKQVKLFADGAFYSLLMQMQEPGYMDGHHGEWLMEPQVLEGAARNFWHKKYQIHVHTNGDLGVKVVLDIVEKLQKEMPWPNHRFTLHHLGYSTEAQSKRMAQLGVLVSANPYYLYTLGDKYSEFGLGTERAKNIFRGGSLIKNGVPLSLHSDFTMAPARPLTLASVAVNRITAQGNLLAPEQRLTVQQALRAITIDAAYAIQMEDEVGSIAVGKKADFTVLEQDPYEVEASKLGEIEIWGTVFEGKKFPL